jgi:hypothetical protein
MRPPTCAIDYLSSASTVHLQGQGGNLSDKHVLSPSDDNGPLALATIPAHNLRQLVLTSIRIANSARSKASIDEPWLNARDRVSG